MCGIAGTVNLPREVIEKMVAHQYSRGPDNTGIYEVGNVIFGHNRLAIIDKSENGNQPMMDGSDMLTYNGEIYNFNKEFSTDTAWVLDQLKIIGNNYNSLNGMFAFGYYNHGKKTVTLVRDRFGIKPLYYYHDKDVFAFASTPAAVSLVKSNWKISNDGLMEFLSLGATQLHSMFEGIMSVPPGHYVEFNCHTNGIRIERWYYPKRIENAMEVIEEKVIQAIDRVKLTCDWPQIILLSGGIDSTLVASRYSNRSAIHLRSPEQEYAEQVAKMFNLDLHTVDPEKINAEEGINDYVSKSGDPTMAGLIPWITCREIAKKGYRVAITANGADELFYGYNRMVGPVEEQIEHIFRPFLNLEHLYKLNRQDIEIQNYLTHDLNKTLDFASMCHSVEVRVPFLDHELVEAAMSIDVSSHVGKFGAKTILKQMLVGLGFDWPFIHRPKIGFSLHYSPPDWESLGRRAMQWYMNTGYPQLQSTNARHENYHKSAIIGLYLWHKKYKP